MLLIIVFMTILCGRVVDAPSSARTDSVLLRADFRRLAISHTLVSTIMPIQKTSRLSMANFGRLGD